MKKVQLLIIGATVLGTAAALKEKDVMIIDNSMLCGAEFVQAYKKTRVDMTLASDAGVLYEPMRRMNIISDEGYVHLLPVGGVLASLLKEAGVYVSFFTQAFEISKITDGFIVKVSNQNGIETIFAEKILDTTSNGTMHGLFEEYDVKKSICATLVGPSGEASDNYSFIRGRFDNETVLELNVDKNDTFGEARCRINKLWQDIHKKLPETRFATCAQRFAYEFSEAVKREVMPGWTWQPSVSYGDLFAAFKEGMS